MRYFELTDDVEVPGRWHLSAVTAPDGSEPSLRTGAVASATPLTTRASRPGRALAFCLTNFAVPVADSRVVSAFARVADGDVQRLAVSIPGHAGFEVLNVLRVVRCLDEARSEFTKWTTRDHRADLAGEYRMVTRLRLDPRAIPPDAHAFRVEGWLIALIVSEPVKEAMEKAGCLGARFSEVT